MTILLPSDTICAATKLAKHLKCDLYEKLNCATDKNEADALKQRLKLLLTKKIRNWKREVSDSGTRLVTTYQQFNRDKKMSYII
jgi:hypothetical protein